ncbi:twin-arginine translocase TatA/TatE family subunit [Patescibacteria group bacterium]
MFKNIGTVEIVIIAVVLLLLFGAKKLPEFARGLGEASTEFRKSFKDEPKSKKKTKKA